MKPKYNYQGTDDVTEPTPKSDWIHTLKSGPVQVIDVLLELIRTHQALYRYYCNRAAEKSSPERYELIRLAERERSICDGLRQFEMENRRGVLETWVRFKEFPDPKFLEGDNHTESRYIDCEEVLAVEDTLQRLCAAMTRTDGGASVQELFKDIQALELERLRKRSFDKVMDQDA